MLAVQDIFVDLLNRRLVQGIKGGEWEWPRPFHTDTLGLRFRFVSLNYGGDLVDPYSLVNISGASLTVSIYAQDATTLLAQVSSFTADTAANTLEGSLNLFTAAMQTAIAAVTIPGELSTYLEIKLILSDGTQYTLRIDGFLIERAITTGATTAPSSASTYLTKDEMFALFVRYYDNPAGASIALKSANGTYQTVLQCNDDGSNGELIGS